MNNTSSSSNMGSPLFHEFKRQASFFLKEKIRTARLALTDVTPAELMTEEATNGNSCAPDTRTLGSISRAAFELDDYWRIVEILHKRLAKFERKNWRVAYSSVVVLEHLLTHGPESVAEEFQSDIGIITEIGSFQHIDEKGFNWGLAVRRKSEWVLKLLQKGPVLKEERDRARKLTRGIKGFGSFCQRSSGGGILQESSHEIYGRSNSDFINNDHQENQLLSLDELDLIKGKTQRSKHNNREPSKRDENLNYWQERPETNENMDMARNKQELHKWSGTGESNPLLSSKNDDEHRIGTSMEDDHPFSDAENQITFSLVPAARGGLLLQG